MKGEDGAKGGECERWRANEKQAAMKHTDWIGVSDNKMSDGETAQTGLEMGEQ